MLIDLLSARPGAQPQFLLSNIVNAAVNVVPPSSLRCNAYLFMSIYSVSVGRGFAASAAASSCQAPSHSENVISGTIYS